MTPSGVNSAARKETWYWLSNLIDWTATSGKLDTAKVMNLLRYSPFPKSFVADQVSNLTSGSGS